MHKAQNPAQKTALMSLQDLTPVAGAYLLDLVSEENRTTNLSVVDSGPKPDESAKE
jgi:hypothetical protein